MFQQYKLKTKIAIGLMSMLLSVLSFGAQAQQAQQVVFVAGDDAATPEIYIQSGANAFMYIQGGISAVNTASPVGESNIAGGTFTGTGTGNVIVDGGLFVNANTGTPGDVRNATNAQFIFGYDKTTKPAGSELTGTLPTVTGTPSGTVTATQLAAWGGTVHLMSGAQNLAGKTAQAASDMVFYNLSLEGDATKTIIGAAGSTNNDNTDLGDVEIGVGGSGASLNSGTLFLNGSVLATQDNLAWVRNPTNEATAAGAASGAAITRVATASGGAGASSAIGMSLTSQNSAATTTGYVTSTNSTRGRLARTTTSGDYLFPTADETGFYRPVGVIGAGAGTYFSRVQQTATNTKGTSVPTALMTAFYNVINSTVASGDYRIYATLTNYNTPATVACTPATLNANPNVGTAQSQAVASTFGFQQGVVTSAAGTADLHYTTSASYPSAPLPAGCGSGARTTFAARPAAASATAATESYLIATAPAACYSSTVPCTPLPITLLSFDGKINGAQNDLYWTTATEQNSAWHVVERSADGNNNWTEIGRKRAAGNSNVAVSYSLVDAKPIVKSYYRLRNIDADGSAQLAANVVILERKRNNNGTVTVYPVPTTDEVKVEYSSDEATSVTFSVVDVLGRVLLTERDNAIEGLNFHDVNLGNYADGTYMLVLDNNGVTNVTKIVKVR